MKKLLLAIAAVFTLASCTDDSKHDETFYTIVDGIYSPSSGNWEVPIHGILTINFCPDSTVEMKYKNNLADYDSLTGVVKVYDRVVLPFEVNKKGTKITINETDVWEIEYIDNVRLHFKVPTYSEEEVFKLVDLSGE